VSRVGVRMYLSIGPGGSAHSGFTLGPLRASRSVSGASVVTAQLRNTGGTSLDLRGSLTLSAGPDGLHAGPFSAHLDTILSPNRSEPITVTLDAQMPRGPWRARLQVSDGLLQRSRVATLTFPALGVTTRPPSPSPFPVQMLIIVGLVAAVAVLSIAMSRRGRRGTSALT
jgi:hypothetical protein